MNPILIRFSGTSFIYSGHFMLFLGALASTYVLLIGLAMKGAVSAVFEMGQVFGQDDPALV